ncbi:hypothetical protein LCGC14_0347410 [marine sediment metagenome]|uniref:Uncharacterized protein n=1 Tax=marine sediment metagenome TaxID=412755 RepID=A0A0F9THA9_9ZZZZ
MKLLKWILRRPERFYLLGAAIFSLGGLVLASLIDTARILYPAIILYALIGTGILIGLTWIIYSLKKKPARRNFIVLNSFLQRKD